MPPVPVLLDCDPGHDDAVAILLAAGWDAVDLRCITTVGGNVELDKTTRNALDVASLAGLDVPIAAGAAGPRGRELVTAHDVHGESGLDGATLPPSTLTLDERSAVQLLADSAPGTLVATGPLTNVAELLERHPGVVEEVVWMGGSTGRGNTRPYAEFNALVDPEAIDTVLRSGVRFTMVGLNLTHQAQATPDVVERIRAIGTPVSEAVVGWLGFFGDTYHELYGLWPPVHDPCALALAGDATIATTVEAHIAVELEGTHTRGATVVDLHGRTGEAPNARVAMELDVPRFWDLVIGAIERL